MASVSLLDVAIAIICLFFFYYMYFKKPHGQVFRNWPVIGMLPGFLMVLHRIYNFGVEALEMSHLTFLFKGPWFAEMDMLFTVDPANIHYILSSNFSNYTKGADFKEVFDVFGEMIFSSDSELWKNQRKAAQFMLNHQGFQKLSLSATRSKLYDGLPLFNQCCEEEKVVDLQQVFQRFTFDTTFFIVTGFDPKSLSIEMPEVEYAKALDDLGEGIFYRHIKPKFFWKLQNRFGLGQEKRMTEADATFDRVSAKYILAKREEIRSQGIDHHANGESEDLLTSHIKLDTTKYELLNPSDDKFLRDTILAFNLAGRDTTSSALSWFFWLLSENPQVVTKIRKEIIDKNISKDGRNGQENLDKLVYLHAALYESMRLYPPVAFQRKSPIKPDVLPSGHKVEANSVIIIFLFALGRMRAVWGEDATEFKPERWVSESGGLRHAPSFKFLSFNAGPRTCPGKQLAMTLMKTVVVEILQNYDIDVIKGQKIEPEPGLMLHMKHGLRVTITKRCSA